MASLLEEQQRRWEKQRPLFERIQDWASRQRFGSGGQVFRIGMFAMLAIGVILFYTGTQFYGLRDAKAMELGQLARNLKDGQGYVTKLLRPSDLHHLSSLNRVTLQQQRTAIPELWTPPVYPWVLSWALRVAGDSPSANPAEALQGDRAVMIAGWVFFLTGLALMYQIGTMLFDRRVAVLASFLYLFCDPLLDSAMGGMPTSFYSAVLMLIVFLILKAEQWQTEGRSAAWIHGAVVAGAVVLGLGILTDYIFAALIVPFLLALRLSLRNYWRSIALTVVAVGLVLLPWVVRNYRVSRTYFGLARYSVIEGVGRGTPREIREGRVQRTLGEPPQVGWRGLARKALMNGRQLYAVTFKETGASYLMVFFLVSLLHRFRRDEVVRMRRLIFWGLVATALWTMVVGVPSRNPLTFYLPVVMLYASAFFYVMFERLQFRTRVGRAGMVALFAVVNCIPFVLAILPPRDTNPYPPYAPEATRRMAAVFGPTEVLASDIPWAVAWYANRGAVWVPPDEAGFMQLHDGVRNVAGLYLTQQTLGASVIEWAEGRERPWINLFLAPPPSGFPLHVMHPITPDHQQILISNHPKP